MVFFNTRWLAIVYIVLILSGCKNRPAQPSTADMDRFREVYIELSRIREGSQPFKYSLIDSSRSVLRRYALTKNAYDRIQTYFKNHPERWEEFYTKILKRLQDISNSSDLDTPR